MSLINRLILKLKEFCSGGDNNAWVGGVVSEQKVIWLRTSIADFDPENPGVFGCDGYTNWNSGEPNGSPQNVQACLQVFENKKWNDHKCSTEQCSLCEADTTD